MRAGPLRPRSARSGVGPIGTGLGPHGRRRIGAGRGILGLQYLRWGGVDWTGCNVLALTGPAPHLQSQWRLWSAWSAASGHSLLLAQRCCMHLCTVLPALAPACPLQTPSTRRSACNMQNSSMRWLSRCMALLRQVFCHVASMHSMKNCSWRQRAGGHFSGRALAPILAQTGACFLGGLPNLYQPDGLQRHLLSRK